MMARTPPMPSNPITITVGNANEPGTTRIERDETAKTLTAIVEDPDGTSNLRYKWTDIATGETVLTGGANANILTYTDDSAHYNVNIDYVDGLSGQSVVLIASTAPFRVGITTSRITYLENQTVPSYRLSINDASDNSVIPHGEIEIAFVLEDGSTSSSYKGLMIDTPH